ncbi:molybdate ABC transporter periplasmic binding protein [Vibrio crassostreae]|uniref:molybdate ABC transporter substrate-binding protein n=1 Tax=Vibrio crassostreae TaxID=246167 RepID=UPI000F480EDA|nr:molybdate ABC transporter substrate-binding protein [Vibrio crassostreae]ROR19873.1 molybdate transport system substrate-binding protein [Vibrio crassostreae]CAK2162273.1 molybdate ABC transporter periplasmic binding protein [Vibrio crassostreae]CAK2360702.1 molybdate ABC transporter periplasmic binding protein [Vibrio crassostreae]CAK2375004.1 molybdate ABC transporter periplasmic binding protein [Vibrio crassostreae]CAK3475545.1 molybdate ABC transporter periplasmic binding protein [Vibri
MKKRVILLAMALTSALISTHLLAAEKLRVYAASSMTNAVNLLVEEFEKDHSVDVTPVYASTSSLVRQIERGAPADIFISANEKWMTHLVDRKLVSSDNVTNLCENELVLISPKETSVTLDLLKGNQWAKLLTNERLAVGNTISVPAGIYAKEALETLGVWDDVKTRLAPSNNVRMALALVERSEAKLGIVYKTDALLSKEVNLVLTFPSDLHTPIRYPVAKLNDKVVAEEFYTFLKSEKAKDTLNSFGFEVR